MKTPTLLAAAVALPASLFAAQPAVAQFDTVINLPEDQTSISGSVGFEVTNEADSTIQLNVAEGGVVEPFFNAFSSVEVNLTGGEIGDTFNAFGFTDVNISAGNVGDSFQTNGGVMVNITGGSVGDDFLSRFGAEVNISGGTIGNGFSSNGVVNITDGLIGNNLTALGDSEFNISGGSVGGGFSSDPLSEVNITGGTIESGFAAGGVVNISGGTFGNLFVIQPDSVVNVSGGGVTESVRAFNDGTLNLFGTEFFLDGAALTTLELDQAFEITDRGDVSLSGVLADGTSFELPLTTDLNQSTLVQADVLLTVTRVAGSDAPDPVAVPQPTALVLGAFAGLGVLTRRRRDVGVE